MNKIKNFKDLNIWQESILLAESIYKITQNFPKDEIYGITSQIRRASISIPSNIAEGFMRNHNKEFKQFLHISLGSSAEVETQLILSNKLGFINQSILNTTIDKISNINRMIFGLIKKL